MKRAPLPAQESLFERAGGARRFTDERVVANLVRETLRESAKKKDVELDYTPILEGPRRATATHPSRAGKVPQSTTRALNAASLLLGGGSSAAPPPSTLIVPTPIALATPPAVTPSHFSKPVQTPSNPPPPKKESAKPVSYSSVVSPPAPVVATRPLSAKAAISFASVLAAKVAKPVKPSAGTAMNTKPVSPPRATIPRSPPRIATAPAHLARMAMLSAPPPRAFQRPTASSHLPKHSAPLPAVRWGRRVVTVPPAPTVVPVQNSIAATTDRAVPSTSNGNKNGVATVVPTSPAKVNASSATPIIAPLVIAPAPDKPPIPATTFLPERFEQTEFDKQLPPPSSAYQQQFAPLTEADLEEKISILRSKNEEFRLRETATVTEREAKTDSAATRVGNEVATTRSKRPEWLRLAMEEARQQKKARL